MANNISFEDSLPIIDKEIFKRRNKVHLYSNDFDFDDLSQLLRIHIYKKWHLWDQTKPLENWINVIISHQINNFIRNNYSYLAPPCYKCTFNQGGNLCGYTSSGEQCYQCPLFAKWEKSKKSGYNIKFADSLSANLDEDSDGADHLIEEKYERIDWDKSVGKIGDFIKAKLGDEMFFIFDHLFVKNGSEEELSKILKFKSSEKNRIPGYKQIYNYKQKIIAEVKKALKEEDIL